MSYQSEIYLFLRARNDAERALKNYEGDLKRLGKTSRDVARASQTASDNQVKASLNLQRQQINEAATTARLIRDKEIAVQKEVISAKRREMVEIQKARASAISRLEDAKAISTANKRLAVDSMVALNSQKQALIEQASAFKKAEGYAAEQKALNQLKIAKLTNQKQTLQLALSEERATNGSSEYADSLRRQIHELNSTIVAQRAVSNTYQDTILTQRSLKNSIQSQIAATSIASKKQIADIKSIENEYSNAVTEHRVYSRTLSTNEAKVRRDIQGHRDAIEGLNTTYRNNITQLKSQSSALNAQSVSLQNDIAHRKMLDRALDVNASKMEAFRQHVASAGSALTTLGIGLLAVGGSALYGINSAINSFSALEKEAALTKTQFDQLDISLQDVMDVSNRLAKEIPVPFEEIQPALRNIASSIGVTLDQAEFLLKKFSKAAVAGNVDIQTVSRTTLQLMNAYKLPIGEATKLLDTQFKVIQKGSSGAKVEYKDFAQNISKSIPSAVKAGQSYQILMGTITELSKSMNVAQATAATGRAFDALTNPKVVKRLKEIGVAAADAKGNFRKFPDVILDLQNKLDGLTAVERAAALKNLFKGAGGDVQANRFFNLVTSSKKAAQDYKKTVETMNNASGTLDKKYGEVANTVAAKTVLFNNNMKILKNGVGQAFAQIKLDIMNALIPILQSLDKWWDSLSPEKRDLIVKVAAAVGILAFALGGIAVVAGVAATAMAFFNFVSLPLILTVGAIVLVIAALVGAFIYAKTHTEQISKALGGLANMVKRVADWFKVAWEAIKFAVFTAASNIARWIGNILEAGSRIPLIGGFLKKAADFFHNFANSARDAALSAVNSINSIMNAGKSATIIKIDVKKVYSGVKGFASKYLGIDPKTIAKGESAVKKFLTTAANLDKKRQVAALKAKAAAKAANNPKYDFNYSVPKGGGGMSPALRDLIDGDSAGGKKKKVSAAKKRADEMKAAVTAFNKTLFNLEWASAKKGSLSSRAKIDTVFKALFKQADLGVGRLNKNLGRLLRGKLNSSYSQLVKLDTLKTSLQKQLDATNKTITSMVTARATMLDDLKTKITESFNFADLFTTGFDVPDVTELLSNKLVNAQEFQTNIQKALKLGFNKDIINTIASQGVDKGNTGLRALLNATPAQIAELNKQYTTIQSATSAIATGVVDSFYNDGIRSAQGFAKGLVSQIKVIESATAKIAAATVSSLRKNLGIHSPSRVIRDQAGIYVPQGHALGMLDGLKFVHRAADKIAEASYIPFSDSNGSTYMGNSGGKVVNQQIDIHTQEINPKKNSADLGWELAKRM